MKTPSLRLKLRQATWNAILEAAEDVAAETGISDASLQAVAQRAGIAVGTIYNYFDDRLELFDALFARRRQELFDAIDDAAKKHARDPFDKQLDAFVRVALTYFDTRRGFLRIALEASKPRPQVTKGKDAAARPALQQLQERAERVVRIGIREKRLRDDSGDLLAAVLVSIVRAILYLRAEGEASFAIETDRVVSIFMHGATK
ncbi:MAG: TetR/AcrR family transcriptional regulator [Myxococcota bacterium]|nr:TetR/AcrR family transcriptional regulator [Myxococcota bacterium]